VKKCLYLSALCLCLLCGLVETYLESRDAAYVRTIAAEVIDRAHAQTSRQKVEALRDFMRGHVRYKDAPVYDRPFFRATAAETLGNGLGYCGEVSRAFICMAETVGIKAQRVNLHGKHTHVVAEADLGDEGLVVVDCQNPPAIPELESLDKIMQRREYDDYSTLNLRRLGLDGLFSRVKLRIGGHFSYFLERPHALKAARWFTLAISLLLGAALQRLVRRYLVWKGWVHTSDKTRLLKCVSLLQHENAVIE
jgi:hypothetical protein